MFDEAQMKCLRALLNTIIPPDDFPGAWEAGVGGYLLRQLAGDLAELSPTYRLWLRQLDAEARAGAGRAFAELDQAQRTSLLKRVERGEVATDWSLEPAPFFRQVVEHCAEGYYSDPDNGGNRDWIGWRMIGYEARA